MGNYKRKVFFFFVVLILGPGFLFPGCSGTLGNPMIKVLAEAGPYAVLFPGSLDKHVGTGSGQPMSNEPFTIEAWVKTSAGGVILARGRLLNPVTDGFQLSIQGPDADFRLTDSTVTSATYIVTDAVNSANVTDGMWHHIAGILVGPLPVGMQHNHITDLDDDEDPFDIGPDEGGTCSPADTGGVHIDIYIDGIFRDCNGAVLLTYLDAGTENIIGFDRDNLFAGPAFTGTIDEVRLWKQARTEVQIRDWMENEISGTDWDIADPDNKIVGYWKFNEGTGHEAIDSSGFKGKGTKQQDTGRVDDQGNPIYEPWLDSWVEGYLF